MQVDLKRMPEGVPCSFQSFLILKSVLSGRTCWQRRTGRVFSGEILVFVVYTSQWFEAAHLSRFIHIARGCDSMGTVLTVNETCFLCTKRCFLVAWWNDWLERSFFLNEISLNYSLCGITTPTNYFRLAYFILFFSSFIGCNGYSGSFLVQVFEHIFHHSYAIK